MPTEATEALFTTTRLRVRRVVAADVDAMHAVYGDAEAMRWVGDGLPLPRTDCERWIAKTHDNYRRRGYGMFSIEMLADGEVVGFCGLVHPGDQPEAEIKYALKREHWGRGLATEAAAALLAFAPRFGLHEVIATTAPDNLASHRVLAKAGMVRGKLRENADGSRTQLFAWRAGPVTA